MPTPPVKNLKKCLYQAQEFYTTEHDFINKMNELKSLLTTLIRDKKQSAANKLLCQNVLQKCHKIITLKQQMDTELNRALEMTNSIQKQFSQMQETNLENEIEGILENLFSLYQSEPFQSYCQEIINSIADFSTLSNHMIEDKLGIGSLLIRPNQRIMRHILFLESLAEHYPVPSAKAALQQAKANSQLLNKVTALNEIAQTFNNQSKDSKKQKGCELLLKLHLNSFHYNEEAIHVYRDEYLKTVLTQAYPKRFAIMDQQLNAIGEQQALMNQALGLPNNILDPKQFSASGLDELWCLNKKPIWLILKSMKPITDDFDSNEKLLAYTQVIQCLQEGALGNKNKDDLIWAVAQDFIQIVKNCKVDRFSAKYEHMLHILNRQLETVSTKTLWGRFQKFIPLFNQEKELQVYQTQILTNLHQAIAEQEALRPQSQPVITPHPSRYLNPLAFFNPKSRMKQVKIVPIIEADEKEELHLFDVPVRVKKSTPKSKQADKPFVKPKSIPKKGSKKLDIDDIKIDFKDTLDTEDSDDSSKPSE